MLQRRLTEKGLPVHTIFFIKCDKLVLVFLNTDAPAFSEIPEVAGCDSGVVLAVTMPGSAGREITDFDELVKLKVHVNLEAIAQRPTSFTTWPSSL